MVVSLAYLASQIRIQNRESRVASVHEIVSAHRNLLSDLNDAGTAEILVKAASGLDELTEAERLRYVQICMNMFKLNEEAYYQLAQGRLEDYIWEGMTTQIRDYLSTDGAKQFWRLRRHQFGKDFREFIDDLEPTKYRI